MMRQLILTDNLSIDDCDECAYLQNGWAGSAPRIFQRGSCERPGR